MTRFPYTCGRAAEDLWKLQFLLHEHRVLAAEPYRDVVLQAVTQCQSCRGAAKAKRCLGWTVDVGRPLALVFSQTKVKEQLVRAELQTSGDYRRIKSATEAEWRAAPVGKSTVTVELYTVADDQLVARQHLDLANVGQHGPLWHLQSGGNPSGDETLDLDWLSVPRWTATPADLVLVADVLAFNLHYPAWNQLQSDGRWVRLILEAEDLLMTHYVDRLSTHFLRGASERDSSWLSAQDNLGDWNPRPAGVGS